MNFQKFLLNIMIKFFSTCWDDPKVSHFINVSLEHKTSLKSLGYICSNTHKYIGWVKMIYVLFYAKNH